MKVPVIISIIVLSSLLSACKPQVEEVKGTAEVVSNGEDITESGSGSVGQYKRMLQVMNQSCVSCHSDDQKAFRDNISFFYNRSWTEDQFINNTTNWVIPGDLDNSELIYRLKHSPSPRAGSVLSMPTAPLNDSFTQENYQAFANWVISLGQKFAPVVSINQSQVNLGRSLQNISGDCKADFPLTIFLNNRSVRSQNCQQGQFSIPLNFINTDGIHEIIVRQNSPRSSQIAQDSVQIIRDTQAPALSILAPISNTEVNDALVSIQGSCENSLYVQASGDINSTQSFCMLGQYTINAQLSNGYGNKNIQISSTDQHGNTTTQSLRLNFQALNTNAPQLSIDTLTQLIYSNRFQIRGDCTNGLPISISGASGSLTCSASRFSGYLSLSGSDGIKTIRLTQQDGALSTTRSLSVTKDSIAPVLTSTQASPLNVGSSTTINGSCEASVDINVRITNGLGQSVLNQTLNCSPAGQFTYDVNFNSHGSYIINLAQTDAASNRGEIQIAAFSDQQGPNLSIVSPRANANVTDLFTVSGSCEGSQNVSLSFYSQSRQAPCNAGNYQFTNIPMGYQIGASTLTLTQLDDFDNQTQVRLNVNFNPLSAFSSDFERARYVMEAHCMSCHASSSSASYGRFTNLSSNMTEDEYLTQYSSLFTRGNADTSPMVRRFVNYNGGDMPLNAQNFSDDLYQAVRTWVNGLSSTPTQITNIMAPVTSSVVLSPLTVSGNCEANRSVSIMANSSIFSTTCSSEGQYSTVIDLPTEETIVLSAGQSGVPASSYTYSINITQSLATGTGPGREPASTEELDALDNAVDLRIGDRHFIYNVMIEIFGPGATSTLQSNILQLPGLFAGGCSIYESETKVSESQAVEFPNLRCYPNFRDTLPQEAKSIAAANTAREGMRMKSCDALVENNTTFNYAMGQAGVNTNATLSNANLQSVYRLFYPMDNLDGDLLNAYRLIDNYTIGAQEKWKRVLYSSCISPDWQIP